MIKQLVSSGGHNPEQTTPPTDKAYCHSVLMDGFILYRVRENGKPAPPMSTFEEYGTRKEMWGARDGALVRALASHQCGPGSNPGVYLSIIIYLFIYLFIYFLRYS